MSAAPEVLYLEADDEVTSVVRRVRASSADSVVVVAPGRSRATSSVVALRLIGRAGEEEGRSVRLVGDGLTRSLAAEAGLDAFATLEEARAGAPAEGVADAMAAAPRRASISVVRGAATDETAPTLVAAAAEPAIRQRSSAGPDDPTRSVPTPSAPVPAAVARRRTLVRSKRRVPVLAAVIAGVLALVAVGAAAAVLPAASVTITPRSDPVGPLETTIVVNEPERDAGTVTDEVEVVATGTYQVEEFAAGTVVLFNWTNLPVTVPSGTFVAAGEQAFATQVEVVVPRGRLTPAGTIAAGEAEVAVVAVAPGPAANVAAEAIDTVVAASVDAQLRGFEENPQRRVTNPAATVGGVLDDGPRIRRADVEAAVAELERELRTAAAEESSGAEDDLTVEIGAAEPVLEGVEGLAGTRDVERATIRGALAWEVLRTDPETVTALADSWLRAEGGIPDGHRLVEGSVDVVIGAPAADGGALRLPVRVTAQSRAQVATDEVHRRIQGRSEAEAEAALADLGTVDVALWPGWVASVPTLDWRVDVRVEDDERADR